VKVKIFTEGGTGIGLGHISRCSALYDEVASRGLDVKFVINGNVENVDLLEGRRAEFIDWLSVDYLNNHISSTDYCIVDSYLVSEYLCRIIFNKSKVALFIDDNMRINYPNGIIVNPSLSVDNLNYSSLYEETILLLGAKYIILRNPFLNAKRNMINKDVKEVLISMGGSDIRDLTPKVINEICQKYPEIKFNVVIGKAFENLTNIKKTNLSNVELHYNITAELMKQLMIKADFAITAAGQTIYEFLATQTPFIPIRIIDNQSNNIRGLLKVNPSQVVIEYDDIQLIEKLEKEFKIMLSQIKRENLLYLYEGYVDGTGNKRIIDRLLGE